MTYLKTTVGFLLSAVILYFLVLPNMAPNSVWDHLISIYAGAVVLGILGNYWSNQLIEEDPDYQIGHLQDSKRTTNVAMTVFGIILGGVLGYFI